MIAALVSRTSNTRDHFRRRRRLPPYFRAHEKNVYDMRKIVVLLFSLAFQISPLNASPGFLIFPHFVTGNLDSGVMSSEITLVNPTHFDVNARFESYNPDGSP